MAASHTLFCLAFAAAAAFWSPVAAQIPTATQGAGPHTAGNPPQGAWLPGGRSYLGLNIGRVRQDTACVAAALLCDEAMRPTEIYTGTMVGNFWGVQLGYRDLGRVGRGGTEARAQGLNISLVGKAQLAPTLRAFGKLGTTYGRADTGVMGAAGANLSSENGFGLSIGAGLSLDFSPRWSATFEWDSIDLRLPGGGRDPHRSTSLGLQYRY